MRRIVFFAGCCILVCGFLGCQEGGNVKVSAERKIETGAELPEFLVGVWKAQVELVHWSFNLERDGTIAQLTHAFGGEMVPDEGGVYVEGVTPETYAVFVLGPCKSEYDTNTRELSVDIVLDYYSMTTPEGEVKGKGRDLFKGIVSEDGKSWKVRWTSEGWLETAELLADPNAIVDGTVELVFTRSAEK